jgi:hypothetical protein
VIPSEQEIFSVLNSMGSTKALGPDGFTALFYKKYWHIVKEVVLACIWDFFGNNRLLQDHNHTFIALIPKQLGASTVHQFQPISLCILFTRSFQRFLLIDLKLFSIFLFHLINQLLYLPGVFKIILSWLMNFLMSLTQKRTRWFDGYQD